MTDTVTTIDIAPIIVAAVPYIAAALAAVASAAVTVAAAAIRRWTGLQVQQAALDSVRHAAANEASALVAGAADYSALATAKITVSSPVVGAAAAAVVSRIPDAIKASGVTPDQLNKMILGRIGDKQAELLGTVGAAK